MQINLLDLISHGREGTFAGLTLFAARPMSDAQQLVNTMKTILLATVAIVAFSAPSFAAEPPRPSAKRRHRSTWLKIPRL